MPKNNYVVNILFKLVYKILDMYKQYSYAFIMIKDI